MFYQFGVATTTHETVFHHISKHRERVAECFDEIRGVWKCVETLSQVFELSQSQSKLKLRSKRRNNLNHRHGYDFVCFNLMYYLN